MSDRSTALANSPEALFLRSTRLLFAMGTLAYPIFGYLSSRGGFHDDMRPRYAVAAVMLSILIGTYLSDRVRKNLTHLAIPLLWAITAHYTYLLVLSRLDPMVVLGASMALTAIMPCAIYMLTSIRQLTAYLLFSNACMLLAWMLVREPRITFGQLAVEHLTFTIFAYVTVTNQINTLKRLIASQEQLQEDIRRREGIEAALRESERRAQNLLEAIPDALLRVDRAGKILALSNPREDKLSRTLGSLRELPLTKLADSSSKIRLEQALEKAFTSNTVASAACEVRASTTKQHAEIRAIATSPQEALVVVRDVTQERALEERLRTSDRLVALGTLASGLAHEINNPLSYVAGNITYAIDEVETRADTRVELQSAAVALREARDGAERIGNIVSALKQFTEAEGDRLEPVDVRQTVESALRMLRAQLSATAEVRLELDSTPRVAASPTRLLQVLLNLVTNALQAFPERSRHQNLIRIKTMDGGPQGVVLEIEDNGCGIGRAELARIFDPFFTTKVGVGTGLGLYLCQRFITSFGGTISVQSEPGKGACFRITLMPITEAKTQAHELPELRLPVMRILIVDDEPLVARSVARMLKGCEATIASSGTEALGFCEDRDFDMILCDMMMPGMDGSQFFDALRSARPELAGQVVFMTGGAFTHQTTAFLANHANPWLQKPVRREWLLDAVQQLRRASVRLERAQRVVSPVT